MSEGNNGNGTIEWTLQVPAGLDPQLAQAQFEMIVTELNAMEPLLPMRVKCSVAQGLIGDIVPLSKLRRALSDAPQNAEWGIAIVRKSKLVGGKDEGVRIDANVRLGEARDLDAVIRTATCFALLTSAPARALLAMHGYQMMITPPTVEQDDDEEGSDA